MMDRHNHVAALADELVSNLAQRCREEGLAPRDGIAILEVATSIVCGYHSLAPAEEVWSLLRGDSARTLFVGVFNDARDSQK